MLTDLSWSPDGEKWVVLRHLEMIACAEGVNARATELDSTETTVHHLDLNETVCSKAKNVASREAVDVVILVLR